jgi:flagellar hook-basal body complex protein FliE
MNVTDAISAYSKGGNLLDQGADTSSSSPSSGAGSFADALKGFATDTVSSLHDGEKAAISGANGKADLASVATAIDNAEVVLNEVVAIRDKVISAYQTVTGEAI